MKTRIEIAKIDCSERGRERKKEVAMVTQGERDRPNILACVLVSGMYFFCSEEGIHCGISSTNSVVQSFPNSQDWESS